MIRHGELAAFVASVAPFDARGEVVVEAISGGWSNLTYSVASAGQEYVVRRRPLGETNAGAHDMSREYRVLAALRGQAVPIPQVYGFCDDASILGAPFYVMDRVPGTVLHTRADVESLGVSAEAAGALSDDLIAVLVRLHAVDPAAVGLGDLGRPEGFVGRRIRRWLAQWESMSHRDYPTFVPLARRLQEVVPDQADSTLVHGDYRLGNVIVRLEPAPHVAAVLDWELATLGDPLTDLAQLLKFWAPAAGRLTHDAQLISRLPGFASADEMAATYGRLSGRSIEHLPVYLAFEHWRSVVLKEAIFQRRAGLGEVGESGEILSAAIRDHLEEASDLLDRLLS